MKTPHTTSPSCRQKPPRPERPVFKPTRRLVPMSRRHHLVSHVFTAEEHVRVQEQIEQRARELWRQRGERSNNPLNDWLQAEGEVVARFIRICLRFDAFAPFNSSASKSTEVCR